MNSRKHTFTPKQLSTSTHYLTSTQGGLIRVSICGVPKRIQCINPNKFRNESEIDFTPPESTMPSVRYTPISGTVFVPTHRTIQDRLAANITKMSRELLPSIRKMSGSWNNKPGWKELHNRQTAKAREDTYTERDAAWYQAVASDTSELERDYLLINDGPDSDVGSSTAAIMRHLETNARYDTGRVSNKGRSQYDEWLSVVMPAWEKAKKQRSGKPSKLALKALERKTNGGKLTVDMIQALRNMERKLSPMPAYKAK